MPYQIWTQDQRPELIMAGARGLSEGLGRGIESLGTSLEKMLKERKREAAQASAADKFLNSLPEDQRPPGLDPHSLKMMGGREKIAQVQGLMSAQGYQKGQEDLKRAPEFYGRMGKFAPPGQLPFDMAPQDFEQFALPEGQTQPGTREFFQSLNATGFNPGTALPGLLRSIEAGQNKSGGALGPDILAQFGMVPTGGQVNPNGTASINFGMPPAPAPTTATPILTEDGRTTGKATFGGKVIDLSPPNSEGKSLVTSETGMLGAYDQADKDLENIEKMFTGLGKDWGGPLSGRVKSALSGGQNPNIAALENAITAATPNLARGVFREVGVLTDQDIKRYQALLPTAYDTDAVRKVKMDQLRERIKEGRKSTMDTLRKAGRDMSGFDKPSNRSTELDRTPAKVTDEMESARQAIKSGKNPDAVKKLFKQRTGQDFPE